jgi:hypothetical protein
MYIFIVKKKIQTVQKHVMKNSSFFLHEAP